MIDLKPCPFCGGSAKLCEGPKSGWWGTMCDDCDVWRDDRHGTQEEAIAAWNTRAPVQITDAMVEAALMTTLGRHWPGKIAMRVALKAALNESLMIVNTNTQLR